MFVAVGSLGLTFMTLLPTVAGPSGRQGRHGSSPTLEVKKESQNPSPHPPPPHHSPAHGGKRTHNHLNLARGQDLVLMRVGLVRAPVKVDRRGWHPLWLLVFALFGFLFYLYFGKCFENLTTMLEIFEQTNISEFFLLLHKDIHWDVYFVNIFCLRFSLVFMCILGYFPPIFLKSKNMFF